MKKPLIILAMAALGSGAKAQDNISKYASPQLLNTMKVDTSVSAFTGTPNNLAQLRDNAFTQKLTKDALYKAYLERSKASADYNDTIYSTMPVAGTKSNSHMPVIKPGDSNTHYTMLVKRVAIVDPTKVEKAQKADVKP